MLVSGREAADILQTRGRVTGQAQARGLLRAGAAGRGVITGPGVYFERSAVIELADRPILDETEQSAACPRGIYIARLARTSEVDLTRTWADVAVQVGRVPPMPTMTTTLLGVSIRVAGRFPWVASLHGFVVFGADVTGFATDGQGGRHFQLEPPGDWFAAWKGHRLPSTRGGRPWLIRRARVT